MEVVMNLWCELLSWHPTCGDGSFLAGLLASKNPCYEMKRNVGGKNNECITKQDNQPCPWSPTSLFNQFLPYKFYGTLERSSQHHFSGTPSKKKKNKFLNSSMHLLQNCHVQSPSQICLKIFHRKGRKNQADFAQCFSSHSMVTLFGLSNGRPRARSHTNCTKRKSLLSPLLSHSLFTSSIIWNS